MLLKAASNGVVDFQLATNPQYMVNWHHDVIGTEIDHIVEHGDRDYKILMVFVPPRHGKSQQCTIDAPAYILGRRPDHEIIVASYSAELSQDFSVKSRDKVKSRQYNAIFPGIKVNPEMDKQSKWGIMTHDPVQQKHIVRKGSYTAVGVGGPITGRGANVFIIDDPIKNREEAESEVYRKKVWDWFKSTAWTRLEPGGVFLIILTRWHQDDLAGKILADDEISKMCKVIEFPAISVHDEQYRAADYPLWPQKYPRQALLQTKSTIGPYEWSALYQQTPILTEDQEFKPEWYKRISEFEVHNKKTRRYLTIDTALKKKQQNDYTGFCDNRVDRENFWHLRAWRNKLGPEELVEQIFTLHKTNRYEMIGIEETTYTEGLKPYIDSQMREKGIHLPLVMLKHGQVNKEVRVRGLIPYYAAGTIYHIDGYCKALEDEQAAFPAGAHDDTVDATAYMPIMFDEHLIDETTGGVHVHRPKPPRQ